MNTRQRRVFYRKYIKSILLVLLVSGFLIFMFGIVGTMEYRAETRRGCTLELSDTDYCLYGHGGYEIE